MLDMPCDDVVDPHIHLFDLRGTPRPMQPLGKMFGWNDRLLRFAATKMMSSETVAFFGRQTALLGNYGPQHYRSDSTSSRVRRYVHIEAGWSGDKPMDPVGETEWLSGLTDGPAAIVGHADLNLGAEVAEVLAAHKAASDRFRGIRDTLSWHPSPDVMSFTETEGMSRTSAFRAGFDQLAEHGLSFDAWCYSGQLDQVAELAAHNPDVPIVLCHAGTPVGYFGPFGGVGTSDQERNRIAAEWRDAIDALASHAHVHCKLSGLLMPVLGLGYETGASTSASVAELVDLLSPIVEHCIAAFGPQRCMVASNFPVDRVSAQYSDVTAAMVEITSGSEVPAQEAMFRDTAAAFYRLDA